MQNEERVFLDMVEERRMKFQRKSMTDEMKNLLWSFREGDYVKRERYAAMLLIGHNRETCISREKSDYD